MKTDLEIIESAVKKFFGKENVIGYGGDSEGNIAITLQGPCLDLKDDLEFLKREIDKSRELIRIIEKTKTEKEALVNEIKELREEVNSIRSQIENFNLNELFREEVKTKINSVIPNSKIENLLNKLVRDCVIEKSKSVENKITEEVNEQINQKVDSIKKLLHFLQKRYKEYDKRATKKLKEYEKISNKKHREIEERYKSIEKEENSTKNEDIRELTSENNEDEQELPQTLDID